MTDDFRQCVPRTLRLKRYYGILSHGVSLSFVDESCLLGGFRIRHLHLCPSPTFNNSSQTDGEPDNGDEDKGQESEANPFEVAFDRFRNLFNEFAGIGGTLDGYYIEGEFKRSPGIREAVVGITIGVVIHKTASPIWQGLKNWRGKTKTNDKTGKRREYYQWDYTHGEIEVFDRHGKHKGAIDPVTGEQTKPAEPGREIDV